MLPFSRLAPLAALLLATRAVAVPTPWEGLSLPPSAEALLSTGKWDATPKGFRVVALSFVADGCAALGKRESAHREAALACVRRCLALAEKTKPVSKDPGAEGLWQSHLALMYGAHDSLGSCADSQEHARLVQILAERTGREPTHHVPSFSGVAYRWPADQVATLAGLVRYDAAHQTHQADLPVRQWREYVQQHAVDQKLGLPWSEVTGKAKGAKTPRGCALSWQTRYLHEVDDALARAWWAKYQEAYLVRHLGLVGFREWPVGREFPADADSGPIVQGVGAAATALGIGAARSMGDDALASGIESTADIIGALAKTQPSLARASKNVLADAIRYVGAQVRP